MRAISYSRPGGPDVLELVDRPVPEPGPGEVRVRVAFSGVNPTDWKSRSTADPGPDGKTPNQDGSGTIDAQIVALHGSVAMYADDDGAEVTVPVRSQMSANARWQFVLVYTEPARAKALAVEDVNAAVLDGAIRIGRDAGLPVHVFPLARTADAHRAVQDGAVGKVLIDVTA